MANFLKLLKKGLKASDLEEKGKLIKQGIADTEQQVAEWAKKKGLPYRETSDVPFEKSEVPFDPAAKQRSPSKEILDEEKNAWIKETEDAKKIGEGTNVSAAIAAPAMMVGEESEDSPNFLEKFKNKMGEAYESYKNWEKENSPEADMRRHIESNPKYKQNMKRLLEEHPNKTLEDIKEMAERETSLFGRTIEEQRQMMEDIAMSSPAMGITKAVKVLGPQVGKLINKSSPLNRAGLNETGEGLVQHYKKIIADKLKYYEPKEAEKFKGQTRKALELLKKGIDIEKDLPVKFEQGLNRHGDEVNMMMNDAVKNIKNPKIFKEGLDGIYVPDGASINTELETLYTLLDHYKDNPKMVKDIMGQINRLEK